MRKEAPAEKFKVLESTFSSIDLCWTIGGSG